ncbi:MAG: 16S rRNA processing protein RimM [Clostridiaceae bacterium]|nr:16S rRNA processing protein RimM [Clostridiaceae bacterium]
MYEYLQIGKIVNTHGIRGELKLIPLTDDPKRFDALERAYIDKDGMHEYRIESVKYFKGSVIIKFEGIDAPEAAAAYKEHFLLVDRQNAVKLPEDTFFICDIIGSKVIDENGSELGTLIDVLQTGSNDVYVVKGDSGKEILIPALKSVVRSISPEQKQIHVVVPKGLLDDEI